MPARIRRKQLGDLLEQHLRDALAAGPGKLAVTVFRGEVTDPPVLPDQAGRVAPYLVLFDGVGSPDVEPDLAGENVDLDWSCQMVVGAGFEADCIDAVDRVHDAAYRWSPTIADLACGRLAPPAGYDPGPLRRNDVVKPPRWWTPLQWGLTVTAT